MAENISPTAGLAAERRGAWSLGLGLTGVVGAILVIAKIKLFTSSGYTLMCRRCPWTGRSDRRSHRVERRTNGRAKLGIAIGPAVVVFFGLVAMEVVSFEGGPG